MRLLALFTLCRAARKPDPASKRLVIISGPRTGSSLLIQMLRAHDQVLMHGEPFHEFDVRQSRKDGFDGGVQIADAIYEERHSDPQKLLEAITATATKELVGFKLFRKHVPSHKLGEVLQWATLMKQKWGDNDPQFTRWDLSCLQASSVYYEGLEAPVVIAGGEDVLVRRPITDDELAYTMLGAPWRRTQIRFGGNGGFAVRDPAFVRAEGRVEINQCVGCTNRHRHAIEKASRRWRGGRREDSAERSAQAEGITIDPRENLDAWANACRKMGKRADDVHLAYKLSRLHDIHKLGAFKPAPREVLLNFAAEMVESPGDPAALHAAWRHLSIDYVVRQFEKVVSVIRDFEAPA